MAVNNISGWFRRQFQNPQIVILLLIILVVAGTLYFFGGMLAPLLAAVVIAYLLQGLVGRLERRRVPHLAAVLLVFLSFFVALVFAFFGSAAAADPTADPVGAAGAEYRGGATERVCSRCRSASH